MIRKWNTSQFEPLLGLWLESTTYAHPFIAPQYWQESLPIVRDTYLPAAETWVFEEEQRLQGFVSVIEARFVGALFVAPNRLHHGIGSALLSVVKQRFSELSLEVYQKNSRAVNFYHAQGFRIQDSAWQDETRHPTWIMHWQADQMPLA
ncbi:N-acetyltransferase [Kluyvera sichuanensis]|uniref:N-acetyltransferase n=1 Tax=Kluyvera sichuanensis TaxID=2725494 RepID=A0ABR6RRE6_9ENTR|nr:N-acetyltransferase [Kluyvera sichuanensis]MBC1185690.1 N-acetyltransferase [Kluyvera sichuanensis]